MGIGLNSITNIERCVSRKFTHIQPLDSHSLHQLGLDTITIRQIEDKSLKVIRELQSKDVLSRRFTAEELLGFISGKNRSNQEIGNYLKRLDQDIKCSIGVKYNKNFTAQELNDLSEQTNTHRARALKLLDKYLFPSSTNPQVIKIEEELRRMGVNARLLDSKDDAELILQAFQNMKQRGVNLPSHVRIIGDSEYMPQAFYSNTLNESWILLPKDKINMKKMIEEAQNTGIKECQTWSCANGELGIIYHEAGHAVNKLPASQTLILLTDDIDKEFLALLNDIKTEVSEFAQFSPDEFCAELFSGLMEGKRFSSKIMELYKHYNGVIPKQIDIIM